MTALGPAAPEKVPTTSSTADEFYKNLLARTTNTRKRNNLIAVKRSLDMMRETKAREYTIAAVARAILALGQSGPKEQSIRNAEGKDYRDLIAVFAADHITPKVKRSRPEDDLVASITDHRAAARVQWIINENKSLQRRVDILHAQFKQLAAIELIPEGVGSRVTAARPHFSDMEIKAVRKFLSSVGDIECCFDTDTGALLRERHGFEIGPPGFLQALLKVVGMEDVMSISIRG